MTSRGTRDVPPWLDELREAERDARAAAYDVYEDGRPTRAQAQIDAALDAWERGQ